MSDVAFLPDTHQYFRGAQELASVSSVLRLIPEGPMPPPEVLQNAADRGIAVDSLLCAWLNGTLSEIPPGVREDAVALAGKLFDWWDCSPLDAHNWQAQVILADDEIAGTADLVAPGIIADLKCTYDVMPKASLQLGAYCHLYEVEHGELPSTCGIIHVTARFTEPKWVPFEVSTAVSEFRIVRDFWRLCQRKMKGKTNGR